MPKKATVKKIVKKTALAAAKRGAHSHKITISMLSAAVTVTATTVTMAGVLMKVITATAKFTPPTCSPTTVNANLQSVYANLQDTSAPTSNLQSPAMNTTTTTNVYTITFTPVPANKTYRVQAVGNWIVMGSITDANNYSGSV